MFSAARRKQGRRVKEGKGRKGIGSKGKRHAGKAGSKRTKEDKVTGESLVIVRKEQMGEEGKKQPPFQFQSI